MWLCAQRKRCGTTSIRFSCIVWFTFIVLSRPSPLSEDFVGGHAQQNGEQLNNLLKTLHGYYFRSHTYKTGALRLLCVCCELFCVLVCVNEAVLWVEYAWGWRSMLLFHICLTADEQTLYIHPERTHFYWTDFTYILLLCFLNASWQHLVPLRRLSWTFKTRPSLCATSSSFNLVSAMWMSLFKALVGRLYICCSVLYIVCVFIATCFVSAQQLVWHIELVILVLIAL